MDELIESIYQAACTPELWPKVMSEVARTVDAGVATILHRDKSRGEGPLTDALFGFTPAQIASYATHFRKVDCRFQDVQKLSPGEVLADDYNFDFELFTETEIYQDFWKPARLGRGLAGLLFKDLTKTAVLTVRRYAERGRFPKSDVRNFQQILPHVRRSLQFRGYLLDAELRAGAFSIALDQFPVAIFLLNRLCAVRDCNRAARELLADSQSPLHVRDQRLAAHCPPHGRELQEAVRIAANSLHDVRVAPPFLRLPLRDGMRILTLVPVPVMGSLFGATGDLVLLFCREAASSFLDPSRLQRHFGFSAAESRLAAAIAEGLTLQEFAFRRGISIGTVRVQLKSTMEKAGVHTQAQLAGAILRSLAALVRSG